MKKSISLCWLIPLSMFIISSGDGDLETRARQWHKAIFTLDTHCDTPLHMQREDWDVGMHHDPNERGSGKIDLPRMENGNLDGEFFALFVAQKPCTPENYRQAFATINTLLTLVEKMCERYADKIALTRTPEQAFANEKKGLLSAFLGVENGFGLGHEIKNIAYFYDRGVRYITLCHTQNNDICDSSNDEKGPFHNGLSDFGREVIAEMNRIGMLVDVSHVSDSAFYQAIRYSRAPVFASHSCCRALCNNPRNLTDDMIRALAAKGGVVQICFFSEYLKHLPANPEREKALKQLEEKYGNWSEITDPEVRRKFGAEWTAINETYPRPMATVQDVADHIDHVVKLVGIDYVGIGTDFDGGGGVIGCSEVSQMPNLTVELVRRGYSKEDIEKIWGGNFMRVWRRAMAIAQEWKNG